MEWRFGMALEDRNLLDEFEKYSDHVFPPDFRETAAANDGGYPSPNVFDTEKTKQRTIKALLSFDKDEEENIWETFDSFRGELGGRLIPFANDDAGNLICFTAWDDSVVFYDLDTEEIEQIAGSFGEFLGKLYDPDKA